jgi:hypothetical protein
VALQYQPISRERMGSSVWTKNLLWITQSLHFPQSSEVCTFFEFKTGHFGPLRGIPPHALHIHLMIHQQNQHGNGTSLEKYQVISIYLAECCVILGWFPMPAFTHNCSEVVRIQPDFHIPNCANSSWMSTFDINPNLDWCFTHVFWLSHDLLMNRPPFLCLRARRVVRSIGLRPPWKVIFRIHGALEGILVSMCIQNCQAKSNTCDC